MAAEIVPIISKFESRGPAMAQLRPGETNALVEPKDGFIDSR